MAKEKQERFRQGVWDFSTFEEYLQEWLIPRTLGDLETLFQGATDRCERIGGARGNFALATALFLVMDHVGAFLRKPTDTFAVSTNWQNISWCAKQLPSTEDVSMFIAFCGRNALVHGTWPKTVLVIQDHNERMRVGFNISADADTSQQHRLLYKKLYPEPLDQEKIAVKVVKLRLNVYTIFGELANLLKNNKLSVDHDVFLSVRRQLAELSYFNVITDSNNKTGRLHDIERDETTKRYKGKQHWREELLEEIRYLHNELREVDFKILPIRLTK